MNNRSRNLNKTLKGKESETLPFFKNIKGISFPLNRWQKKKNNSSNWEKDNDHKTAVKFINSEFSKKNQTSPVHLHYIIVILIHK